MGSIGRDDRKGTGPPSAIEAVDELLELLAALKHVLPKIELIDQRLAELEAETEKLERARQQFYIEISEMRGNSEMLSALLSGAKDLAEIRRIGTRVLTDAFGGSVRPPKSLPRHATEEQRRQALL